MCKPASFLASIFKSNGLWWERRGWKLAPLLAAAGLLAGCMSTESIAPPVSLLAAGNGAAELSRGRAIYLGSKCTSCHTAEPVAKYPAAEWPGIVREMSPKAKLGAEDESAVLAYVLAASRAPRPPH
jgi:hypothetical protein